MGGWEGLYGRPRRLALTNHTVGKQKEGRRATIKALPAPTDVDGLFVRLMRITADLSAPGKSPFTLLWPDESVTVQYMQCVRSIGDEADKSAMGTVNRPLRLHFGVDPVEWFAQVRH